MEELARHTERVELKRIGTNALTQTMVFGFLLRIAFLMFILTLGKQFSEPYFISDDRSYENLVEIYLEQASGVLDYSLLNRLLFLWLQPFWPIVMCCFGFMFQTVYAGRFINVILSVLCIKLVYRVTDEISGNSATALRAARLFAYMPVTVITCCFPIKDIYITVGVFYALYLFVRLQNNRKITIWQLVLCTLLLVGVYFSRGAVVEMTLMFFGVFLFVRFAKNKNYLGCVFLVVAAFVVLYSLSETITNAFQTKIEDYGDHSTLGGNGIKFVQINSISQIYKLPLTYFFATLQPFTLELFTQSDSTWLTLLNNLNVSIYPIAIGNFLYIFVKKKNLAFWFLTLVMYSAVIILSLGVFRHYLFLLPVEMINFSLCIEEKPRLKNEILTGSIALLLLVLLLTFIRTV